MKYVPKPLTKTADVSRGRTPLRSRLKFLLTVVIVLGGLYLGLGLVADVLARTLPDSWESRFGVLTLPGLPDDEALQRPRGILASLMSGEELRDLDYEILLLDIPQPNAFTIVGGRIAVTRGLLEVIESETGLAFVLAHELGHHQHRDNLRRMGRQLLYGVVLSSITGKASRTLVEASYQVAESGYSRKQETAADTYAMQMIEHKYGDTGDALEFFYKMREKHEQPAWQQYFTTHPLTAERIENLEEKARRTP